MASVKKFFDSSYHVLVLATGIDFIALLLDLLFPLGVAGGITQILPVLVGIWLANKRQLFFISILATGFIIVGYLMSPEGGVFWVVFLNRILSVIAVLACSAVIFYTQFYKQENRPAAIKSDAKIGIDNIYNIFGPGVFIIGFSALLLVVIVMFYATREQSISQEWVAHTQEVKTHIGKTLSLMQDLETGQRGFLLTGEDYYLGPYNTAINKIDIEGATIADQMRECITYMERHNRMAELVTAIGKKRPRLDL